MPKKKSKRVPSYQSYKRQYLAQEEKLEKLGYTMAEGMMSKKQFTEIYYITKWDYESEVLMGDRRTVNNITRDIVKMQAYQGRSHKQASAIYNLVKKMNEDIKMEITKLKDQYNISIEENGKFSKKSIELKKQIDAEKTKIYKYNYAQIRMGDIDWTLVKNYKEQLRKQGLTTKEVNKQVSVTFFGSPK